GEKPDSLRAADRVCVVAGGGGVQGGNPVDMLPLDAQRLTAGGEQPDVRAVSQQRVRELRAGIDDVLAVVQQDQHAPLADRLDERAYRAAAGSPGYAQH